MTNTEYLSLLDYSPLAIMATNEDDQIVFANLRAKDDFDINLTDAEQTNIRKVFPKSQIKWEAVKEILQKKGQHSFDATIKKVTGATIDVKVQCQHILMEDKPLTVCYIRDISDQQIIIRELFKEQQFTKTILDSIPALVFVKDTQNKVVSVNRAFEDVTGLTNEVIRGKSVSEITNDQELANSYWKDDLDVIKSGLPKRKIIEQLFTDQNRIFVTDKIPYRTYDGDIVGIIGFSTEISDRINVENALLESEKKYRLLFDTSPEGAFVSTLDGKIISTNAALRSMLNYTEEEMNQLTLFDLTPDEQRDSESSTLQLSVLFGDTVEPIEKNYLCKDGKALPVVAKGWVIKDQNGVPAQIGAFIRDITHQKLAEKLEASLLESQKAQLELELENKNRELNAKIAQLIEKNGIFDSLMKNLEEIIERKPESVIEDLKELVSDLKQNKTEDFWSQFEMTFGKINKSFYDNLYERFPKLSNNEKKISAFLRMNMSTKDISKITHQTVRSIEMARTRLRKKLNLTRSDNLSAFLAQF